MKIKTILIIIISILMIGCRAKRITTIKETIKIDSVSRFEVAIIQPPITGVITIQNPCDSLGNLKPFKQTIKTNVVDVSAENINGAIVIDVNIDSIKQHAIEVYKSKNQFESIDKTIIKYRVPKWAWLSLIINILGILYIFRKLIPGLKLLPF